MTLKSLSWLLALLFCSISCSHSPRPTKWDCLPSLTVIHLPDSQTLKTQTLATTFLEAGVSPGVSCKF